MGGRFISCSESFILCIAGDSASILCVRPLDKREKSRPLFGRLDEPDSRLRCSGGSSSFWPISGQTKCMSKARGRVFFYSFQDLLKGEGRGIGLNRKGVGGGAYFNIVAHIIIESTWGSSETK